MYKLEKNGHNDKQNQKLAKKNDYNCEKAYNESTLCKAFELSKVDISLSQRRMLKKDYSVNCYHQPKTYFSI